VLLAFLLGGQRWVIYNIIPSYLLKYSNLVAFVVLDSNDRVSLRTRNHKRNSADVPANQPGRKQSEHLALLASALIGFLNQLSK